MMTKCQMLIYTLLLGYCDDKVSDVNIYPVIRYPSFPLPHFRDHVYSTNNKQLWDLCGGESACNMSRKALSVSLLWTYFLIPSQ